MKNIVYDELIKEKEFLILCDTSFESIVYTNKEIVLKIFRSNLKKHNYQFKYNKSVKAALLEERFSSHPQIVVPFGTLLDREKEIIGLASPYVAGENLSMMRYNNNQHLVVKFFVEYSKLVKCLHKNGCVFGDATSNNCIVSPEGKCHLIDVDSASIEEIKNDCTNYLANSFLIELGITTSEELKRMNYPIDKNYDRLTQLLEFMRFVFGWCSVKDLFFPGEKQFSNIQSESLRERVRAIHKQYILSYQPNAHIPYLFECF